jgi:hypothetical protein
MYGNPQISNCDLCMCTTGAGSVISRTLLFRTYYSCAGSVIGSCTHNRAIYLVCSHGNQHISFNPTCYPWEQWLEVQSFHSTGDLINHTRVSDPNKPVSIYFDVCAAIAKNTATWGYCGGLPGKGPIGYMTNMCPETTSLVSVCASYEQLYCPYWGCVVWATWQRKGATALLQKGEATSNCALALVTL